MKFIIKQIKQLSRFLAIAIVIFLVFSRLIAPSHTPQKSELIKGVWLSHFGNAFLTYASLTDNAFHQLSLLDYNRVYVDVYNAGTTYFRNMPLETILYLYRSPIL